MANNVKKILKKSTLKIRFFNTIYVTHCLPSAHIPKHKIFYYLLLNVFFIRAKDIGFGLNIIFLCCTYYTH